METIGFIGLGNMGSRMAGNIQKSGYPLVVYDVREEVTKPFLDKGARLGGSPAEVARLSDVTFTSLPGPAEVEEVAVGPQGILEGIEKGSVYVEPVHKPAEPHPADRAEIPAERGLRVGCASKRR